MPHIPVLLNEVINYLDVKPGDIVLDGTAGSGGHSFEFCKRLGTRKGRLICIDEDKDALFRTEKKLSKCKSNIFLVNDNFRNIDKILKKIDIDNIDKAIFDLGLSSNQLEESARGFSFSRNEPLLMTFSDHPKKDDITAYEIVNSWDEDNIADIIFGYGEEKYSRKIARGIVSARKDNRIKTTFDLVEIIKKNVPMQYVFKKKIHFATKTFQAIRIAVNDEIRGAREGIEKTLNYLNKDGVVAVITFHSIEDRMVKLLFREKQEKGGFNIITKKPVAPTQIEIDNNPRARSAKLRVCKKI